MSGDQRVAVGLDVGGTTVDGVLLDGADRVLARVRHATARGGPAVLAQLGEVVAELARLGGVVAVDVVGVGIPGSVDPSTGVVAHAANLDLREAALGADLARRTGAQVAVENDVKVAALGVHRAVGGASLAYLNVGTGLAAAVVLDGVLLRGVTGNAGEIGHLAVDPGGAGCRCGQRGCLETVASGSALARQWGPAAADPELGVFAGAARGDPAAVAIVERLHGGVATAVQVLALGVDCAWVVLGGGVGHRPAVADGVRAELRRRAAASPFLAALGLADRVRTPPAVADAAARAAAAYGRAARPGG